MLDSSDVGRRVRRRRWRLRSWWPLAALLGTAAGVGSRARRARPRRARRVDVLLALVVRAARPPAAARGVGLLYRWAAQGRTRHTRTIPCRGFRVWCWFGGLLVLFIALASPIGTYDTTLFSVHMVQHLLMTMVAAPLLVMARADHAAAARLLVGDAASAGSCRCCTRGCVRVISFPVVAWVVFAGVMWVQPLQPAVRRVAGQRARSTSSSTALPGRGAALLVAGGRRRSLAAGGCPTRPGSATCSWACPQSSFLGLAIFSAPAVLYAHYATLQRTWGPTPLEDQQSGRRRSCGPAAAAFPGGAAACRVGLLRAEEAEGRRVDARLDRERAAKPTCAPPRQPTPPTNPRAADLEPSHGSTHD